MFTVLSWLLFGFIVGIIAKFIHPGDEPVGFISTILIGVVGSFVGGLVKWMLSNGSGSPLQPSDWIMSILGGVLTCAIYRWYKLKNSSAGPKSFLNGKQL